jgi:hypothetical protein
MERRCCEPILSLNLVFSNAFKRANSIYCPTFCCFRRGYAAPESMTLGCFGTALYMASIEGVASHSMQSKRRLSWQFSLAIILVGGAAMATALALIIRNDRKARDMQASVTHNPSGPVPTSDQNNLVWTYGVTGLYSEINSFRVGPVDPDITTSNLVVDVRGCRCLDAPGHGSWGMDVKWSRSLRHAWCQWQS